MLQHELNQAVVLQLWHMQVFVLLQMFNPIGCFITMQWALLKSNKIASVFLSYGNFILQIKRQSFQHLPTISIPISTPLFLRPLQPTRKEILLLIVGNKPMRVLSKHAPLATMTSSCVFRSYTLFLLLLATFKFNNRSGRQHCKYMGVLPSVEERSILGYCPGITIL